ncbi:MAG: ABC transporter ATP-binding protein [Candidatus Methylomirabilia bacterium]
MLRVSDLRVSYGRIEVLHGISFEAKAAEVTCLIGPNGAGKSTTLATLAGVLRAGSGRVQFGDKDLTGLSPPTIVGCGLSLVPENRMIFPGLSVRENLRMGAYQRLRTDKGGVAEDIGRMLGYFPPLRERLDQEAGTLSGGEQQMLAVARALMARPKMLMLDEPSLGLGPIVVAEIFEIIRALHREGVSILLVEQNVQWALSCAQHVVVLELGQVAFDGSPAAFSASEVIHKAYLGRTSD